MKRFVFFVLTLLLLFVGACKKQIRPSVTMNVLPGSKLIEPAKISIAEVKEDLASILFTNVELGSETIIETKELNASGTVTFDNFKVRKRDKYSYLIRVELVYTYALGQQGQYTSFPTKKNYVFEIKKDKNNSFLFEI